MNEIDFTPCCPMCKPNHNATCRSKCYCSCHCMRLQEGWMNNKK